MGNRYYRDFDDGLTTGLTFVNTEGSAPTVVNSFTPAFGSASNTKLLRFTGGQTGFGTNGAYTTTGLGSCANNIIWFGIAFSPSKASGGTSQMKISLETSGKLWTSNTGIFSLHYDEASPYVKSYSGTNLIQTDALDHAEFIWHGLKIQTNGSVRIWHAHNNSLGSRINPWKTAPFWSTTMGVTTVTDHADYSAAGPFHLAFTFFGGASDQAYLTPLFWTSNGILIRPPSGLSASATSATTGTLTWTDPILWT